MPELTVQITFELTLNQEHEWNQFPDRIASAMLASLRKDGWPNMLYRVTKQLKAKQQ